MFETVIIWLLVAALVVLVIFHVRLRGAILHLTDSLRNSGPERPHIQPPRLFMPSYVRTLSRELERLLEEAEERQRSETQQQRLYETVLNNFNDGFLIVGDDLSIRFANRAAREQFANGREIVGKRVIEAFLDHRIAEVIGKAADGRQHLSAMIHLEQQRVQHRGETMENYVWVEAGALPVESMKGGGLWVFLRDDSERHHVEQVRRDFVANASHEIRTPLSIISGYLETLLEGGIDDKEAALHFLEVMNKHSQRLSRLVDDMLAVSKLEGSPEVLQREPFDIAESVTDMVEQLQPLIQTQKATVVIDFPQTDRSILGDRFYWDQIFFNLIENSLKQNEAAGLEIVISLRQTRDEYVLQIRDNGVGIPGSHLPHIFKRFYRVEKHRAQAVKGTGLGLSIVKRAVEAHGGTISVGSRAGIETTFTIRVPKPKTGAGTGKSKSK